MSKQRKAVREYTMTGTYIQAMYQVQNRIMSIAQAHEFVGAMIVFPDGVSPRPYYPCRIDLTVAYIPKKGSPRIHDIKI